MTYELTERERKAIEDCGWRIIEVGEQNGEPFIDIENWSPLGEDLQETIWLGGSGSLASAARKWADDFDADDHVAPLIESRGQRGVPSSVADLVRDASSIQEMLCHLAAALEDAESRENDDGPKWYDIPVEFKVRTTIPVMAYSIEGACEAALKAADENRRHLSCADGVASVDLSRPIRTN